MQTDVRVCEETWARVNGESVRLYAADTRMECASRVCGLAHCDRGVHTALAANTMSRSLVETQCVCCMTGGDDIHSIRCKMAVRWLCGCALFAVHTHTQLMGYISVATMVHDRKKENLIMNADKKVSPRFFSAFGPV
jgi:hypothetical protein